jgi:adenosyl cobinamide kinase/adenosyl cobinamide phosphate guanylyltransferase
MRIKQQKKDRRKKSEIVKEGGRRTAYRQTRHLGKNQYVRVDTLTAWLHHIICSDKNGRLIAPPDSTYRNSSAGHIKDVATQSPRSRASTGRIHEQNTYSDYSWLERTRWR